MHACPHRTTQRTSFGANVVLSFLFCFPSTFLCFYFSVLFFSLLRYFFISAVRSFARSFFLAFFILFFCCLFFSFFLVFSFLFCSLCLSLSCAQKRKYTSSSKSVSTCIEYMHKSSTNANPRPPTATCTSIAGLGRCVNCSTFCGVDAESRWPRPRAPAPWKKPPPQPWEDVYRAFGKGAGVFKACTHVTTVRSADLPSFLRTQPPRGEVALSGVLQWVSWLRHRGGGVCRSLSLSLCRAIP